MFLEFDDNGNILLKTEQYQDILLIKLCCFRIGQVEDLAWPTGIKIVLV